LILIDSSTFIEQRSVCEWAYGIGYDVAIEPLT